MKRYPLSTAPMPQIGAAEFGWPNRPSLPLEPTPKAPSTPGLASMTFPAAAKTTAATQTSVAMITVATERPANNRRHCVVSNAYGREKHRNHVAQKLWNQSLDKAPSVRE